MIKLTHLSKTYDEGKHYLVDDVSLEVKSGELLVILGSSGSGKTTLLKMINRLITPSSGLIEIDGQDVMQQNPVTLRRSIGYAFQEVGLFPHMTVEENISIVLRLMKVPLETRMKRAHELLHLVNLDPQQFATRPIFGLSGGQQQRIGVARALATDPKYLLMDEPFGALDTITRTSLQDELRHLHKTLGKTILFVTHDIFEAFRLADRIAVMHQGQLQQLGSKEEIIGNPATEFVKNLIQKPFVRFAELIETIIHR